MGAQAAKPEEGGRPWDGVLRREIAVELRVIDEAERSVEVIASTEALDSHGDVVKQFWDLERYNKNGAVLWNHNIFESSPYAFGGAVRPEDVMPVGKGSNVQVAAKKLTAKLTLVKGSAAEEPFIDKLWRRISQGVIKAVSVGFRPGEQKRVLNASGGTDHYELGSAENPNELVEISFVPMGSNPEAVAKSIAWERRQLDESITEKRSARRGQKVIKMDELTEAVKDAEKAKADLLQANVHRGIAEQQVKSLEDKLKSIQTDLTAEKITSKKLGEDLEAVTKTLNETRSANAKIVLDDLQGKKFAPAEREDFDALVKDLGLERVQKMLEKRITLSVTEPIVVDGKALPTSAPAPASISTSGNGSADLAAEATKGL